LDGIVCKTTGLNKIPVIAVATHDTNSAIAAIPAIEDNWAFISSGTWSLMGFESQTPIINDKAFQLNFSNEGGVGHTFDILKNHTGLWILQQCRNAWKNKNYDYGTLVQMAELAKPFKGYIDIDDMQFLNPSDIPEAINNFLKTTNQNTLEDDGQMVRIILESLALKYAETFHQITDLKGTQPEKLYLSGGGLNNEVLCQYTANATGVPVKTGLTEGSAAGNIMVQALGKGTVKSLEGIRKIIANSFESKTYYPKQTELWKEKALEYSAKIYHK
jgi:rhamnulokinase